MIMTEEELRHAWRNGQGELPDLPPGTRFTPAAADFLASIGYARGGTSMKNAIVSGIRDQSSFSMPEVTEARMVQDGNHTLYPGKTGRLVITRDDLETVLPQGVRTVSIAPGVTVTDAARDELRSKGVRMVFLSDKELSTMRSKTDSARTEPAPKSGGPAAVASGIPAGSQPIDTELFARARAEILRRLGNRVDPSLVDAILARVMAGLLPD